MLSDAEQSLLAQGAGARVSEKQALHRHSHQLDLRWLFSGKEYMADLKVWSEGCKKKSTRPTKEISFSEIKLRCPNHW